MNAHTLARTVAEKVQDPAAWLRTLRILAERTGLDVTRCLPVGVCTLIIACDYVTEEARKQGRVADLEAAAATL